MTTIDIASLVQASFPIGYTGSAGTIGVNGFGANNYTANIGNGTATSYSINHNLNTPNIIISMVKENSSGNVVYPDIVQTNSNYTQITFVSAPTTNQYSIIILGP
jgi:hypothetical protein